MPKQTPEGLTRSQPLPSAGAFGLYVDFDGDSALPGASSSARFWSRNFPTEHGLIVNREWGRYAEASLALGVRMALELGKTPTMFGGGHGNTYFTVRELCREYGALNLLHIDAHHDRYTEPRLCHWSVMSRIQRDLPVALHPLGHRFELERAEAVSRETIQGAPWYVSWDLDVFPAPLVQSVMHSVADSRSSDSFLVDFLTELDRFEHSGNVVGVDVVEWDASRASAEEQTFVIEIVQRHLERWVK
ncbi:arginase family protein [Microbacterium sp.]|uniref:arginase family protein n=1 Tax=Microbacterium sp. TaxID=51671 RepID=UPI003F9C2049